MNNFASTVLESIGIDNAGKLEEILNLFGASIEQQLGDIAKEMIDKEYKWAEKVQDWWKQTSPYETTNLMQSISIDHNKSPKQITVGVDVNKLLSHSGQIVEGKRTGKKVKLPSYDYTEEANRVNVSASYEPYGIRQHIPFISEVWYAYAERALQELF